MNNKLKLIEALNTDVRPLTPAEWAEKKRYLSKRVSPNHSGQFSFKLNPYAIKIANSFSPMSPAQIISIMKGSQTTISISVIFTILGWIMDESPANTLYITENEEKIRDQMQGPIDELINNTGLADVIGNHNIRERTAKGRRKKATGDTLKGITFPDGHLYTLSGQTIGSLSSWSIKYGIYDEVERWKGTYKNAGDFMELVEPRHRESGSNRKLLFASTPEVKQTSNIEPLYELGDKQKYFIPCLHCGEMIDLVWNKDIEGEKAGIYYEREKNGKFVEGSAMYICQNCGEMFSEVHKFNMYDEAYRDYKNGSKNLTCDWKATAEPESAIYESYHISTLYSPQGFYSWNDLARKWCEIHPIDGRVKKRKLQTFYNQELGLTWEEYGTKVKSDKLQRNVRNYDIGVIPRALSIEDGNGPIILLTVAIDLNGEIDDARLDYEVVAWSASGSTYSIDHGSIGTFQRSQSMRSGQAKEKAKKEAERIKYTYRQNYPNNVWSIYERDILTKIYPTDDGGKLRPIIHGVDTGHFTVYANAFVQKHSVCYALKGKSHNNFTRFDQIKSTFTRSQKVPGLHLVEGDIIKDELSELMTLIWNEDMGIEQPAGFMNFPKTDGQKYTYNSFFVEFEGEERQLEINDDATAIGSRWTKKHSSKRNHFWDCRVYNRVARDIIVEKICKAAKVPVNWENFVKIFK